LRITPDTNVLVRVVVSDDGEQSRAARNCLAEADAIFLTTPTLCETAWVLRRFYGASRDDVSAALRAFTGASNAVFDERAVSMGLELLRAGGDFADGAIAATGMAMGAETFVSFDRSALKRLAAAGVAAQQPS
jgi:predicted nucleic-acid-binding protein